MNKTNQEILNTLYNTIKTTGYDITSKIGKDIERITETHTQTILIAIAAAFGILLILGIVIIWNQHKIKKILRELQEQKTEDKP